MSASKRRKRWGIATGVVGLLILGVLSMVGLAGRRPKEPPIPAGRQTEMVVGIEIAPITQPAKQTLTPAIAKVAVSAGMRPQQAKGAEPGPTGSLPPLRANYRRYMGFVAYARCMEALGAAFYLYQPGHAYVYRIDPVRFSVVRESVEDLSKHGFSPRSRVISDEPALKSAVDQVRQRYGLSDPEIVMLVPTDLEGGLSSYLAGHLPAAAPVELRNVVALDGHYRPRGHGMCLVVTQVTTDDGRQVKTDLTVPLG